MSEGIVSKPWYLRVGNITGFIAIVLALLDAFGYLPMKTVTEIIDGAPVQLEQAVDIQKAIWALLGVTAAEASTKIGRLKD